MRLIYILSLICVFVSCNQGTQDNSSEILDGGLKQSIDAYIKENPLDLPFKDQLYKNGFSYPSYHIFFRLKNKDTIMSIVQFAHLNDFKIDAETNANDEDVYKSSEPDGFLIYKEKYPLIFFGLDYYGKDHLKKHLQKSIPDSLKYNKENYHIDFVKWDYQINNNNFKRID